MATNLAKSLAKSGQVGSSLPISISSLPPSLPSHHDAIVSRDAVKSPCPSALSGQIEEETPLLRINAGKRLSSVRGRLGGTGRTYGRYD